MLFGHRYLSKLDKWVWDILNDDSLFEQYEGIVILFQSEISSYYPSEYWDY